MTKFTHSKRPEAAREIVAYIDKDGDLRIPTAGNPGFASAIDSQTARVYETLKWNPAEEGVQAVFHPGDSITITF